MAETRLRTAGVLSGMAADTADFGRSKPHSYGSSPYRRFAYVQYTEERYYSTLEKSGRPDVLGIRITTIECELVRLWTVPHRVAKPTCHSERLSLFFNVTFVCWCCRKMGVASSALNAEAGVVYRQHVGHAHPQSHKSVSLTYSPEVPTHLFGLKNSRTCAARHRLCNNLLLHLLLDSTPHRARPREQH